MQRELLTSLVEWKNEEGRKPLILNGVRQCGKNIVPIEVKSERHVVSRSLSEYIKKYQPEKAIKTSMNADLGGETVIKLPLYLIDNLKQML